MAGLLRSVSRAPRHLPPLTEIRMVFKYPTDCVERCSSNACQISMRYICWLRDVDGDACTMKWHTTRQTCCDLLLPTRLHLHYAGIYALVCTHGAHCLWHQPRLRLTCRRSRIRDHGCCRCTALKITDPAHPSVSVRDRFLHSPGRIRQRLSSTAAKSAASHNA